MYQIEKVKWDGSKVRLEYSIERKDGRFDEQVLASFDTPLPSLPAALAALAGDVCAICEIGQDYAMNMRVSSVSFSHTNDILGAVITGVRPVKTAQSPVVLNTPHLTEKPYGEGGQTPLLQAGTLMRLRDLIAECERYIDGERAQQALPLTSAAAAAAPTPA